MLCSTQQCERKYGSEGLGVGNTGAWEDVFLLGSESTKG